MTDDPSAHDATDPGDTDPATRRARRPPTPDDPPRPYSPAPETPTRLVREHVTPAPATADAGALVRGRAAPAPASAGRRRPPTRTGVGTVVAAALLSAVLASGGTVLASAPPARSTAAAAAATGAGAAQRRRRQAGHDRRVVGDHRRRGQGQPRRRPDHGHRQRERPTTSASSPTSGVGSGVIYDAQRLDPHEPATSSTGSDKLDVELKDGRDFTGTVYGIDTLTDLAIVKIDATDLPAAAIGDSDALKVGQLVVAIGSPLGTYTNTVTSGIVSATGRTDHDRRPASRSTT